MLSLVAIWGHLCFGLAVLSLRAGNLLKRPLAGLCLVNFAWSFAAMAYAVTGVPAWHLLDVAASPFVPALMLEVMLVFVGRRRELRAWLWGCFALSVALSTSALAAFVDERFASWTTSRWWSATFLVLTVPSALLCYGLAIAHGRSSSVRLERQRVWALLSALTLGLTIGLTDVWAGVVVGVPRLSHLGVFLSSAVIAASTLRLRLLDATYASRWLLPVGLAALVVLGAILGCGAWLGPAPALGLIGVVAPLLLGTLALRQRFWADGAEAERARNLGLLGKIAAQMSHDLRNPLAALKGAAEYLEQDLGNAQNIERQRRYLSLMLEQIARIQRAVQQYDRIARVEPYHRSAVLNGIVERAVALQQFAESPCRIDARLDEGLPVMWLDEELLLPAIENVLQNAVEATPGSGVITVTTSLVGERARLSISDTGRGMDARECERAVDDFYTTKTTGSGLGLPFAKRVANAHGGELRIHSVPTRGTTITFDFPLRFEPSHVPPSRPWATARSASRV